MTDEEQSVLKAILLAILDTCREAGELGAPASALFLPLQEQGFTLVQFQALMSGLVDTGMLKNEGDVYVFTGLRFI